MSDFGINIGLLSGVHFEWLWAMWFLPLPALAALLPPLQASYAALNVPFFDVLADSVVNQPRQSRWLLILAGLVWGLLLLAATRPQWVGEPIAMPLSGRDLMLAVDLSGSMKEADMQINRQRVNRLQAVQQIAGEFIEQREGDRLGLILFGTQAYLQSPLTLDRRTVKTLLNEAFIGMAGEERTAIGNAIALAVKRLQSRKEGDKVLILLTDGENNGGNISPEKATELAAKMGLKVYTIGIGSNRGRGGFFGGGRSGVDERSLQQIAKATGGRHFRARDSRELAEIYAIIDQLETVEEEVQTLRPVTELFYWPASLAFALGSILLGLRMRWQR